MQTSLTIFSFCQSIVIFRYIRIPFMHRTNSRVKGARLNYSRAGGDPIVVGSSAWYDSPLIRTKLCQPRIGSDVIPRAHLIERLNAGLSSKITLLSAPNGFGKTTL